MYVSFDSSFNRTNIDSIGCFHILSIQKLHRVYFLQLSGCVFTLLLAVCTLLAYAVPMPSSSSDYRYCVNKMVYILSTVYV